MLRVVSSGIIAWRGELTTQHRAQSRRAAVKVIVTASFPTGCDHVVSAGHRSSPPIRILENIRPDTSCDDRRDPPYPFA